MTKTFLKVVDYSFERYMSRAKLYGLVPIMLPLLALGLFTFGILHWFIGGLWFFGWFFFFAYEYNKTWNLYLKSKEVVQVLSDEETVYKVKGQILNSSHEWLDCDLIVCVDNEGKVVSVTHQDIRY